MSSLHTLKYEMMLLHTSRTRVLSIVAFSSVELQHPKHITCDHLVKFPPLNRQSMPERLSNNLVQSKHSHPFEQAVWGWTFQKCLPFQIFFWCWTPESVYHFRFVLRLNTWKVFICSDFFWLCFLVFVELTTFGITSEKRFQTALIHAVDEC